MNWLPLAVVGIVVLALVGSAGVTPADRRACPADNPGQGLVTSTDASDGTSLTNALDGITRAVESVGCPSGIPLEQS